MVNAILAKRVNHIVTKGDNPAWPKGSKSRGFSMELINKDTLQIKEFISSLDSMLIGIESIVKHYKPHLNGERFLSNNEVSKKLNVSLRTLQEWRDTGLIPFIQIKGKIIYRQSDIDKLLQKHYFESWKE